MMPKSLLSINKESNALDYDRCLEQGSVVTGENTLTRMFGDQPGITPSDRGDSSNLLSDKHVGMKYTHYESDRISQLQSELSQGLPKDAEQAKQLVLMRFRSMNASVSQRLENSAKGLEKAMRYGIDGTPATVFDGQTVIYGVTDVDEAIGRCTRWRERSSR
jgi:integrating conjugative element protein (TIGR03757 family)